MDKEKKVKPTHGVEDVKISAVNTEQIMFRYQASIRGAEQPVSVLIDTGAGRSFIDRDYVKKH